MAPHTGMRGLKRPLIEIGFFSLVINALMLVIPLYMLQVYDRVLPSASRDTLTFLSIMAVLALALLAGLEIVRSIYASRVAARLDVANAGNAMRAAMQSDRAPLGDVQSMRDLAMVRGFLGSRTVFALFDLPFAPLFIVLLWFIHPVLFWLTAGGAVVLTVLAIANQWVTARRAGQGADSGIAAMMTAQSFVRNAEALRAMGMTGHAVAAFGEQHARSLNDGDTVAGTNAVFAGLSRFLRLTLQIAVLGVGALLVLSDGMTPGMIFAASIISGRGLQPIDQVIGGWRQFVDVHAAWRRFGKAMPAQDMGKQRTDLPNPKGTLRVENATYAVSGPDGQPRPVLSRIDFEVPAGTIVGVIGPSGAGKSTLARLAVGAIAPKLGRVRIDGADIAHWPSDSLGKHIGYLPQDVDLLPGTIAQNIARFSPGADDAAIIEAAQRAQVHDLIQSMPEGYDTVIGPQGLTLSGGQRQRIGLARAFFGSPCLLVLDEPNANLDGDGEAALERAIDAARQAGATVLIVTQRKSIAAKVDRLLVVKNGRIDDYGPTAEVMERQHQAASGSAQTRSAQAARQPSSDTAAAAGRRTPNTPGNAAAMAAAAPARGHANREPAVAAEIQ